MDSSFATLCRFSAKTILFISASCCLRVFGEVTSQIFEVYHINPLHMGPIPINMDVGDALGDLYFDLKFVLMQPLLCLDKSRQDCKNPETSAPDLVVNKLQIEVFGNFSGYATCNIGLAHDKDTFGRPCQEGKYCCICGNPWKERRGGLIPCPATVGSMNISDKLDFPPTSLCNVSVPVAAQVCWQTKLIQKLRNASKVGWWYSTVEYGYCPLHPHSPSNCTWRVRSVDKIINKTCHANSFFRTVEARDQTCFDDCGTVRNTTSECWTRCFYSTVLGVDAGKPGGAVTGIPMDDLVHAWEAPFRTDDPLLGGCPGLPTRGEDADGEEMIAI
eukprot:TRINITY_DN54869_c0_g1_i1.p1 TRINITY_DN54869_c0_g1~~TRINITY_DN54869_c0_g1_i1.p1  ORF type:complete len:347 (+),score=28.84 TRINITY_DN54869_c0_g1_i1:51-1043(+)